MISEKRPIKDFVTYIRHGITAIKKKTNDSKVLLFILVYIILLILL